MSSDEETYEEQVEDFYSEEEISEEEELLSEEIDFDEEEEVSEEEVIEEKVEEEEDVVDEQWQEEEEELEDEEEQFDDEDVDLEDDFEMNDIQEVVPKMQRKKEFNINFNKELSNEFYYFNEMEKETFQEKLKESMKEITPSEKNQTIILSNIEKEENKDIQLKMMRLLYTPNTLKDTLQSIKEKKIGYDTLFWEKYKELMVEEVTKLKKKEEIESEEGSFVCPKCNKNQTRHYQVQLRSADEPMSIIIHCKNKECRHRWRIG